MDRISSKRVKSYKFTSLPQLLKKAQKVFNAYIRERDKLTEDTFRCISCGQIKRIQGNKYHAGHYYPAGQYPSLRFDEMNVNGECLKCNYYEGDHLIRYRNNLIDKIGQTNFDRLEILAGLDKRHNYKWDRLELIVIINKYTRKLKKL